MKTDYKDGWNKRRVRYEEVHNVTREDLTTVAKSLDFQEGDYLADLMSGYGAVAESVLDYYGSKNVRVYPIMVDNSKEQLQRSEKLGEEIIRVCQDVRSLTLPSGIVDGVTIKMGVHEVPRNDQYKVIEQAYRILKPQGRIVVWDLMFKSKLEQLVFQRIVQEKDRLAGFPSLAINRYLPREEEIREYLTKAGFRNIKLIKEMYYTFSSEKRLHAEFDGGESKLEEWNEFIRAIVPEELKENIQYEDTGSTIKAVFRKGILKATKDPIDFGDS